MAKRRYLNTEVNITPFASSAGRARQCPNISYTRAQNSYTRISIPPIVAGRGRVDTGETDRGSTSNNAARHIRNRINQKGIP
jgi:hypothetical protein